MAIGLVAKVKCSAAHDVQQRPNRLARPQKVAMCHNMNALCLYVCICIHVLSHIYTVINVYIHTLVISKNNYLTSVFSWCEHWSWRCRIKWMRWPHFRALQDSLAHTDKTAERVQNKQNLEVRNSMTCDLWRMGLLKIFYSQLQQNFRFFCRRCRKNPCNVAKLPVKTPFSKNHFC